MQNELRSIELSIVKDEGFSDKDFERIKMHFSKYLGKDISLKINVVDNIDRGPRGKYQVVLSNL